MKLRVFPSDKGDCLLLFGHSKGKILCDGGMQQSFTDFVADQLTDENTLDLVYVSHVDDDHIAGILKLLDNAFAWRLKDRSLEKVQLRVGDKDPRSGEFVLKSGLTEGDMLVRYPTSSLANGQTVELAGTASLATTDKTNR